MSHQQFMLNLKKKLNTFLIDTIAIDISKQFDQIVVYFLQYICMCTHFSFFLPFNFILNKSDKCVNVMEIF